MLLLNDYDDFSDLMAVPLNFIWILVEIQDPLAALTTTTTAQVVGETIGPVLRIDEHGISQGTMRVRVYLPRKGGLGFLQLMSFWSDSGMNVFLECVELV